MFEKDAVKRKKSIIAPIQPGTCNHPIYAQMLTVVCQAIRIFFSLLICDRICEKGSFTHPINQV